MTSPERFESMVEERVLPDLRRRYEERGYRFAIHPKDGLPDFMIGYVPDAIAYGPNDNIAIEVRGSPTRSSETVARLRSLFAAQPGWRFLVVYGGTDPQEAVEIPSVATDKIRTELAQVQTLLHEGHNNAAMLMAFALLEAVLQWRSGPPESRPRRPATVIQNLAMNGLIGPERETRLRSFVSARNRIAHGDLTVSVTPSDVQFVLDTIGELLTGDDEADKEASAS